MKKASLLLFSLFIFSLCKEDALDKYKNDPSFSHISIPKQNTLPYFIGKDMQPIWDPKEKNNQEIRKIIPFSMTNQIGKNVTDKNLFGNISVVSFFFTKCSGICPMITTNIRKIQDSLINENNFLIYSFSATPDLDTPDVLKEYGNKRGIKTERWNLLTGNKNKIYELARNSFNADTIAPKENTRKKVTEKDFLHSENLYLLDKKNNLRGIYNGRLISSIDELIMDYAILKNEVQ